MITRRLELTMTFDPTDPRQQQWISEFTDWIKEEIAAVKHYPDRKLHDLTCQVTDIKAPN